ncbi:hypothetical protein ABB37_01895 [Leptomonas pyrrhocoris]|uniref:Uncharacterized protein n=1 Tax=Leptomonas pyrrhocoris TaxID=157538 RepID=A0A0N0VGQ2_LEPPY|nr:hypothetical protein ABB37_01895 [Leptomonas pyrrhocoris]KPA83624.1 hypothetical protein ABB37_01895 [Leptomonas pyrrhocoris]|eukprot:XP_015662063.1 hypothetical protein ABB37_01895 [Leptomonas pyrrhocoris]
MAELQSQVKLCINSTDDFLASSAEVQEQNSDSFVGNTYRVFLERTWYELPLHNVDGSALATVSCMSLWELLNEYTSICNPLEASKKAFAVQALTAMYPKSKDRRYMFQQLNCCGNNAQTAVPLYVHIPLETSMPAIPENDAHRDYVTTVQAITKIARLGSFRDGKETSTVSALIRGFVTAILPKCTLVDASNLQSSSQSNGICICLCDSSNAWNSGVYFLMSLWSSLFVGEYLNLVEFKELVTFLRSSRWSSQTVRFGRQKMSYSKILSPLTDISALCVSLNPRSPSASVDTVPLIDPRIVQLLCGKGYKTFSSQADTLTNTSVQHYITEINSSLVEKTAEHVKEQLNETIPNEIDLLGFSSTCRDFDQLAYLCRDLLFLPSIECLTSRKKLQARRRDLLFNRKRGRRENDLDGPCFIPVNAGLSHVMEKKSSGSQVALERLCSKWKKE